jgi:hypothetical protein
MMLDFYPIHRRKYPRNTSNMKTILPKSLLIGAFAFGSCMPLVFSNDFSNDFHHAEQMRRMRNEQMMQEQRMREQQREAEARQREAEMRQREMERQMEIQRREQEQLKRQMEEQQFQMEQKRRQSSYQSLFD